MSPAALAAVAQKEIGDQLSTLEHALLSLFEQHQEGSKRSVGSLADEMPPAMRIEAHRVIHRYSPGGCDRALVEICDCVACVARRPQCR